MSDDNIITFDTFAQLDLRVGSITAAERVPDSDKLVRLQVYLGDEFGHRQVVAGIGTAYEPGQLVDTQIIVVVNLKPRTLMGLESRGMLLAAHDEEDRPILVRPEKKAPHGSKVS
jgi:methionine--tRNA ligase beta chain